MGDFDVLLHTASKQSQLAWRPVSLSVTAARDSAAAGRIIGVDAADRRRVADAPWTSHVGHTRGTVAAVQLGTRRRR